MDKYTAIREAPTGLRSGRVDFTVHLVVDHQSFCVTPVPYDRLQDAEWMRCQLALALHKLVAKETK